jgi:hypothetical protein
MWQCSLALKPEYAVVHTHGYKIPGYGRVSIHVILKVEADVQDILFVSAGAPEKCNYGYLLD